VSRKAHDGFTERFKQALEEAGLAAKSRKELGRMFGVTGQAIKKWLEGESIPAAERAPLVARKLDVRRAWLLDNELPMRVLNGAITEDGMDYGIPDHKLSYEEQQMLLEYRRLSKRQQKNWLKLLKDFIEATEK
jgi:transcriptional regulator with XRE-family HTH domain